MGLRVRSVRREHAFIHQCVLCPPPDTVPWNDSRLGLCRCSLPHPGRFSWIFIGVCMQKPPGALSDGCGSILYGGVPLVSCLGHQGRGIRTQGTPGPRGCIPKGTLGVVRGDPGGYHTGYPRGHPTLSSAA